MKTLRATVQKNIDKEVAAQRNSLEPEWQAEYQRLGYGYSFRAALLIIFSYPFGIFADIQLIEPHRIWFFLLIQLFPSVVILISLIIRRFYYFRHEYLFLIMCFSLFLSASHRVENQDLLYYIFNNALCLAGAAVLNIVSPLYPIIVCVYVVIVNVLVEKFLYFQDLGFYFARSGGIILTVMGIFFVLVAQLRYRILRNNFLNSLALKKSYELLAQKNQIIEANARLLKQKNDDITASINYAQRIQSAILPFETDIQKTFPKHFIFYKPRDIVSGDFYWFANISQDYLADREKVLEKETKLFPEKKIHFIPEQQELEKAEFKKEVQHIQEVSHLAFLPDWTPSKAIIAAVDCTGHGVPGAFMSMLGSEALDNIILQRKIYEPNHILTELDHQIRVVLKQQETKNQDGMDLALCVVDFVEKKLFFAGARNPLVYIQDNEIHQIKGDKYPIGGAKTGEHAYHKHIVEINKPTTFYIFSDGYQDQFGGEDGKKFMSSRLRALLLEIHSKDMLTQKNILEQTLSDWMKDQSQVDDVLVMGFKIE